MTTIVIDEQSDEIPTHEDGTPYYAVFLAPGMPSIFADTLTEIVAEIIPDYTNSPGEMEPDTEEALIARLEMLERAAQLAQAVAAADVTASGRKFTEDQLTAMLSDKSNAAIDLVEPWEDADVPLLLVTTNYAPFTPFARPEGSKIVWLDPTTELAFLKSLASVYGGELMIIGA